MFYSCEIICTEASVNVPHYYLPSRCGDIYIYIYLISILCSAKELPVKDIMKKTECPVCFFQHLIKLLSHT